MKVKKSALEVVNGMSEREQLALLKFMLNGLTTLTIKQSVATICANIIGERNVKVKQVVIEWEEGGSTAYSNQTTNEALIKELRLQLKEEKEYLAQSRRETDEANRRYEKLCTNIKNLV